MTRWSDLAEWRGPTPNHGGAMFEQRGLVVHIAQGYYEGTIAWQLNDSSDVSSHFIVAGARDVAKGVADGKLAQIVDTDVTAWTQRAGNGHWLSVECSGFVPDKLSAGQVDSIAQLYARGVRDYGWPLRLASSPADRGLAFHALACATTDGQYAPWVKANTTGQVWGHCDCPGDNIIAQLPTVLDRARQILNGGDMLSDDDLTRVDAKVWHGDVDSGARSISAGTALLGTYDAIPRIEAKLDGLLTAIGALGSSNPDVAAILAGVDDRLNALEAKIEADTRDAIGDALEGGATAVRADA